MLHCEVFVTCADAASCSVFSLAGIVCVWPGAAVGVVANATSFRALKKLLLPVVGDLILTGPCSLTSAEAELRLAPEARSLVAEPAFNAVLELQSGGRAFQVRRAINSLVLSASVYTTPRFVVWYRIAECRVRRLHYAVRATAAGDGGFAYHI